MKRIACLMMLTALSSPASARDSYSFVVGGHRIHIEASPHCRSLSCVSVSIPGVGHWRHGHRDSDEITTVDNRAPATAPAPAQQPPQPAQPPAESVSAQPVAARPAPPLTRAQTIPPAAQTQPGVQPAARPAPAAPPPSPVRAQPSPPPAPKLAAAPPPAVGFDTPKPQPSAGPAATAATAQDQSKPQTSSTAGKSEAKPQDRIQNKQDKALAGQPTPHANAPVPRVSQQSDGNAAATPIGDWQTESKSGAVRIEACGQALCGYMLDVATGAKGETILINMKPKSGIDKRDNRWRGNVYSRSSGNSYYGTMTLKEPNTLRVEACAFASFFCSGNNWTRLEHSRSPQPDRDVAISRRDAPQPRS